MVDKNKILIKFSTTCWIEKEKMRKYFERKGYSSFEDLYNELQEMRGNLFNYLFKITEPDIQLTDKEIVNVSEKYLKEHYSWIDKKSIKSVNNHILWMSWHEGLLK